VACAQALLQDLIAHLGPRFVDLLVGDALYLQAPLSKLWKSWAWTGFSISKKISRNCCWKPTAGPPAPRLGFNRRRIGNFAGALAEVDWPVADRLVRVVKTERIDQKRQVHGHPRVRSSEEEQDRGNAREHQLLRHQFPTRLDFPRCSSTARPQSMRIDTKCFRPSRPTATSSTPQSTRVRRSSY